MTGSFFSHGANYNKLELFLTDSVVYFEDMGREQRYETIERLAASEEVRALREFCERRDIKAIMLDADDTIWETKRDLFDGPINQYGYTLAALMDEETKVGHEFFKSGEFDVDHYRETWRDMWIELRKEYEVNPASHFLNARLMAEWMGLDADSDTIQQAIEELRVGVYETVPTDIEGAWELVQMLKLAGVKVILVTHAQQEWTQLKLQNWRGEFDKVISVSVDEPKDWMEGLLETGVEAHQTMSMGDSWWSDVMPTVELGVGTVVWMNRWEQDYSDPRVIEITRPLDLIDVAKYELAA